MWRIQVLPIRAQSFTSLIADFLFLKNSFILGKGKNGFYTLEIVMTKMMLVMLPIVNLLKKARMELPVWLE